MNEILDTAKYPYLMNKKTMAYSPANQDAWKHFKDEVVPITREQAIDLEARGVAAGVDILRSIVAADNAEALKAAEAQLDAMAPAPEAAPAEPAEPSLKDMPLSELREMAKKDGGFPDGKDVDKASRRELLAILQD